MYLSNRILLILTFLFFSYNMFSQTYEDIVKQMEAEFEEYAQKNEDIFQKFSEENDKIFSNHLREAWEQYNLNIGINPDDAPKPDYLPEYNKSQKKEPVNIKGVEKYKKTDSKAFCPIDPGLQKKETDKFETMSVQFNFYGKELSIYYDVNFIKSIPTSFNEDVFANYWDEMCKTNYNHFINQLKELKADMNLNDWGYFMLIKKSSEKIFQDAKNETNLLTWFIFSKSRYKIRVSHKGNNVYLLVPSLNTMYGHRYYEFNNIKYYLLDANNDDVMTYEFDFPDAKMLMDFNIYNTINIGNNNAEKTISFNYEGKNYPIKIKYNINTINFFKEYPLVDIKVYFNAAVSIIAKESLSENFLPIIKDMSNIQAVNFILNFVQSSFGYKTDKDQFGKEKFLFPEEVIFYPFSDCEDRSSLFTFMIKDILNLEVVGLAYKGHFATAINFNQDIEGDFIEYNGEKYIISDPTFKNAPVGMLMTEYRDKEAEIIIFENIQNLKWKNDRIWEKVFVAGGERGSNGQNIIFDNSGNSYVTGYFTGTANFGEYQLISKENSNDIFVAKYNNNGNIIWVKRGGGPGNDIGNELLLDKEGNCYVTGSFEIGDKSDVFVSKYNPDGKIVWTNKVGVDTMQKKNNNCIYVSSFDMNGKIIETKLFDEDEIFKNYGLTLNNEGICSVTGLLSSTLGFNVSNLAFDTFDNYNAPDIWKKENDRLISLKYESSIAGLFAFIYTAKLSGTNISGKTIQKALDKYNSNFKKASPSIYENIGKMNFIRNKDGIIIVITENQADITFDALKIQDKTKIKVTTFKSGNTQIDILSGANVGKAFVRFNLNFIKLFKDSGDLVFDYSSNHSQQKLNLKKDILF